MSKLEKVFLGTLLLLITFGLVLGINYSGKRCCTLDYSREPYSVQYVGKVVFSTEEEYSGFKAFVGQDVVSIWDIKELASTPPIVVQYNIRVPNTSNFIYSYTSKSDIDVYVVHHNWYIATTVILVFLAVCAGLSGLSLILPEDWD